jgi:hypothetical protein
VLTERDRLVLDVAARTYRHQSAREAAIRDELDLSWTRYCIVLNQLIDRPEALAYAPGLVRRLAHIRSRRRQQDRRTSAYLRGGLAAG